MHDKKTDGQTIVDHACCSEAIPRTIPEGTVPLVSVEGTAYECGRQYGEVILEEHPGERDYLDKAYDWRQLSTGLMRLVEDRAPYLLDLYRGLCDAVDAPRNVSRSTPPASCTSFGVSGSLTLDGRPLAGQTKDTGPKSATRYIVLRMRLQDAPTILVLAYPGEVLGYGLWSTGMSIFRNSLHSSAEAEQGLTMVQWGLLALAGNTVDEAAELAVRHGLAGSGNFLVSDGQGQSSSIEFNAGGVSIITSARGIATHANHPEGRETAPFEHYPDERRRQDSRHRCQVLRERLEAERGRLTPPKAMMCLADHTHYPWGICNHLIPGATPPRCTTAAVVAEPTRGRLHVVRGNPCSNWPVSYEV